MGAIPYVFTLLLPFGRQDGDNSQECLLEDVPFLFKKPGPGGYDQVVSPGDQVFVFPEKFPDHPFCAVSVHGLSEGSSHAQAETGMTKEVGGVDYEEKGKPRAAPPLVNGLVPFFPDDPFVGTQGR